MKRKKVVARPSVKKAVRLPSLRDPFFEDFFPMTDWKKPLFGGLEKWMSQGLTTDIKDLGNHYELQMEIPGVKKEEIEVTVDNGYLTVQIARSQERDVEETSYIRRERGYQSTSRSFYVGPNLSESDIHGKVDHGILTLHVPKKTTVNAPDKKKVTID